MGWVGLLSGGIPKAKIINFFRFPPSRGGDGKKSRSGPVEKNHCVGAVRTILS